MSLLIYLPAVYAAYKIGKGIYVYATAAPAAGATAVTFTGRACAFLKSVF